MSDDELRATIRELIIEMAPARPEEPTADLLLVDDLGYSSLSALELVFALEDELGVDLIGEGDASYITTVRALEDHVLDLIRAEQAPA